MRLSQYKNNKGFTLIELIVSLLISSLVMASIVFFVTTGLKQYQSNNTEVTLQMEAQAAGNQINDLLLEADAFSFYTIVIDTDAYQTLVITTLSGADTYYNIISVNEGDKKLLLFKVKKDEYTLDDLKEMAKKEIENRIISIDKYLLANYVKSISVDPERSSSDKSVSQLVHIIIELELNSKTFQTTHSLTIRNGLH